MQMTSALKELNTSMNEARSLVSDPTPPQTLDSLARAIPHDWDFSSQCHHLAIFWELDQFPRRVRKLRSGGTPENAIALYARLDTYLKLVHSHCDLVQSDPFLYSRHILTVFLSVMLIDHATVSAHPILLQHPPDIHTTFLDSILVSDRPMLVDLRRVQRYFTQRNEIATYASGPMRSDKITADSLEVRFAENSESMGVARKEILAVSKQLELQHLERYSQISPSKPSAYSHHHTL